MAKTAHPCAADCPERSAECKTSCARYREYWDAQRLGYKDKFEKQEKAAALDAVQWRGYRKRRITK